MLLVKGPVSGFLRKLSDEDLASVVGAMGGRQHGLRSARHLEGDIYGVRPTVFAPSEPAITLGLIVASLDVDFEYSDEDWTASAGHRPLMNVDVNQVVLLYRHWIAADLQRQRFRALLPKSKGPDEDEAFLVSECFVSMYLWYALLWVAIEGFQDRSIDLRGQWREDIDEMEDPLRRCRNAIFHVPEKNHDLRLFDFMHNPNSAAILSRISTGFGRLFIEEGRGRRESGDTPR